MRLASLLAAALMAAFAAPAFAQDLPPTPIGELQRNTPVTIAGVVERFTDEDEFILRDETGSVLVYVGPNPIPAAPGERITVTGMVDEDARLEVYADVIVRADGTRVDLPRRY